MMDIDAVVRRKTAAAEIVVLRGQIAELDEAIGVRQRRRDILLQQLGALTERAGADGMPVG